MVFLKEFFEKSDFVKSQQATKKHAKYQIGIELIHIQSNLGYPNVDYPKLLGYSKTTDSPDFFLYYLLQ